MSAFIWGTVCVAWMKIEATRDHYPKMGHFDPPPRLLNWPKSPHRLGLKWTPCWVTYTVLHMFRQVLFGAGNQGNHQNFEKSLLTNKLWHVFMGMKQKKFFFLKKKFKMADSKKLSFSTSPKAEQFLPKFHGLVLGLVGLIDAKGINVTQPIWPSDWPT